MAAFTGTPASSATYAAQIGTTPKQREVSSFFKKKFLYTHVLGAGTGSVNLILLPPGRITIYSKDSWIEATAMVSTADLHLGYRAYTGNDGVAVVEDDNAFLDNADSGGGAVSSVWLLPAVTAAQGPALTEFDTKGGVLIFAMIDTANIEDTDIINGYVAWTATAG